MKGAVDISECPRFRGILGPSYCRCGKCSICDFPKHSGVHGPVFGSPPGSEPWGHEFKPINSEEDENGNTPENS
jgi:hypothetical protein